MLKKMGCIVLVLAFLFISASADKQNTHSYTVYNTPMDWYSAKEFCEQQGGHLVTITSEEEQDTVAEILRSHGTMERYWIGIYSDSSSEEWQWVTGEPVDYTNWWMFEAPADSDIFTGEILATIPDLVNYGWHSSGSWWEELDTSHLPHGFICEWDVITSSSNDEDTRSDDSNSNMRMLLLQGGSALSYCISNGKIYASAYELAKLKGCSYSDVGKAFASKTGIIYGFFEDDEVVASTVGNDLVDLQRAAEMLGLVFTMGEDGRATVRRIQTAADLKAAVARVQENADYRKYETFISKYYWVEYAGTEIVGNILSFEWLTRIFEKISGTYDQEQFNNAFNQIILHNGSYEQAVKSYKDIEASIADPLNMLNWFEDAANKEDGALFKLLKALGDSDNDASRKVREWGNLFYEAVYSDPVTTDLLELADIWEGISDAKLDKYAKDIFSLVNYCSAIANADELTILGMRSVFQEGDNQYMRNSAQRIDDIYANNVTGGLKAGAQDWIVENLNKQISESAAEILEQYGIGNDWDTATEVIKTVWGLVDEHITHSSDYVDQVALNSVLLQLQLEEYSKLVSIDPSSVEQLEEYHAVAVLYLRTLLAIYDNGYFDNEDNKAQVVYAAQADLRTLLQFTHEEYAAVADNEEFLNQLLMPQNTSTSSDVSPMEVNEDAMARAVAMLLSEERWLKIDGSSVLATHYKQMDLNADGIWEIIIYGVGDMHVPAFEIYTYDSGMMRLIGDSVNTCDLSHWFNASHNVSICDGKYVKADTDKASAGYQASNSSLLQFDGKTMQQVQATYRNEEMLISNSTIVSGIKIGAENDFITQMYQNAEHMMDAAHSTQDTELQLSIGDYVQFGNLQPWQIVNLDGEIATLFYSGGDIGVFDASIHMEVHTISLMRYHSYGSATWEHSDVRQWLNSREATDTGLDVAFDYSNLAQGFSGMGMSAIIRTESGNYAYAGQPGFLSNDYFSDLEYWLLEPTENISIVPYTQIPGDVVSASSFENFQADMSALYTENVGQTSTVDRMFLLSAREIQEYLIAHNISPFVVTSGGTYPAYWLRDSVYSDLAGYYFYYGTEMLTVANNGASSKQADLSAYIRPACNINLNYINALHGGGTADDPYTFEIDPTVINRPMPEITTAEEAITPSATIADPTEESASNASSSDVPVVQVNRYFEAAFAHAANKIDKALCLQSAYASKKVYNETKIVDLLVDLGFDASTIEQQDYSSGATHSVGITMANRIVKDEAGEPITLYALIVRGTEGTMEWISDFDIGEGNVALGFDKAASRAMRHFAQYVKNNPPLKGGFSDGNYKVWTCGHSRGAAVANLLAGKYLSQYLSADNVYAYGFAVPYVDKKATRCSNIFNFNIAGDLIPNVPFNAWSFERYGLTIYNTSNDIHGVAVNTEANIRLMVSFLLDSVPTQKEYVSRTKEFLQIIEGNPASQEVDLEFMIKGLLSTCTTAGTIPELLVKLDANEDLEFLANLIDPGSLPDDFVYTTEDFITTLNHIGTSHSMDTYLLWIEDICASEN